MNRSFLDPTTMSSDQMETVSALHQFLQKGHSARLVGAEGASVELPDALRRLLFEVVRRLEQGGESLGSSRFCLDKQLACLRGWTTNLKVQAGLFVSSRVLLSPELQQERWHLRQHDSRLMNPRVTSRTE